MSHKENDRYIEDRIEHMQEMCDKIAEDFKDWAENIKDITQTYHDDLMTKGCDDYHAQKDAEAEREASQ